MSKLGLSIYPEHSTPARDKEYLLLASKYGFSRVFTCLLSVNGSVEEIKKEFIEVNSYARSLGYEVIVDVAPSVFTALGITYDNLSFFKEILADGIRLDEGFDGSKEAMMTYNKENLLIEINASNPGNYLNNILSFQPDKSKLIACHNFYPQKYSGLGYNLFLETSSNIKNLGLRLAAFVSSQNNDTYGPWPVKEGLCTLEIHRNLPISAQARHLFATGLIDDVLIGNAYASEEELKSLSLLNPAVLTLSIDSEIELNAIEKEIVLEYNHVIRGDMSDYMARSTMPREVYSEASIVPMNTRDLKRGDVVLLNNEYGRYKGEVHIILKDMPNDGNKNVVGSIPMYEHYLLDYCTPWKKFAFILN